MTGDPRPWLRRANSILFTTVAGLAGFCAYFSMYAFRKPFSAATYGHVAGWTFALDFKIALVLDDAGDRQTASGSTPVFR